MIYYASDLHLEQIPNYNHVLYELKQLHNFAYLDYNKEKDILILAGDTFIIRWGAIRNQIFDILSDIFKDVYIIIGNHELNWGYDTCLMNDGFFKKIRKNVYLVNNVTINHDGYKIIMTTLFSKIDENPYVQMVINQSISDFKFNTFFNNKYSINIHNMLFDNSFNYIKNNINGDNIIIATHFAPTFLLQKDDYKTSNIKSMFYTELHDFIYDNENIKYWIYGHTHYNKNIVINKTQILSNQLGYYNYINEDFEFFKHI